ncbi:MAG: ATP synthase F1 subunit delta [Cyclobacteriaceae bacterium]
MSNQRIANRYAKSIFLLASDTKQEEEILKDMLLIAEVFSQNRELMLLIHNPVVRDLKKYEILKRVFSGKINAVTLKFLEILGCKGRVGVLPEVAEAFTQLYNEYKGLVPAKLTLAIEPYDEIKKSISSFVAQKTGKTPLMKYSVDPNIIGGYILTVEGQQLDNSVAGKLQDLRVKLANK